MGGAVGGCLGRSRFSCRLGGSPGPSTTAQALGGPRAAGRPRRLAPASCAAASRLPGFALPAVQNSGAFLVRSPLSRPGSGGLQGRAGRCGKANSAEVPTAATRSRGPRLGAGSEGGSGGPPPWMPPHPHPCVRSERAVGLRLVWTRRRCCCHGY